MWKVAPSVLALLLSPCFGQEAFPPIQGRIYKSMGGIILVDRLADYLSRQLRVKVSVIAISSPWFNAVTGLVMSQQILILTLRIRDSEIACSLNLPINGLRFPARLNDCTPINTFRTISPMLIPLEALGFY